MIGAGVQTLLKATQAARSVVPKRPLTIITGPPHNKISKVELITLCTIFAVSNFAYPVYVLYYLSEKRKLQ